MENKQYTHIDKSTWGPGPWQNEPDKEQWTDEATGFPCLINRGPTGALCGYVGLSSSHPYFEKNYDDVPVKVHGGLTFSNKCQPHPDGEHLGICHKVEPGEDDDIWWVGFDCAHAWDITPAFASQLGYEPISDEVYRTRAYVKSECASLAQQLKKLADYA